VTTISELIQKAVQKSGGSPALIGENETVSFAELERRAKAVAGGLARLGVGKGDRVAIWLPNITAWLETFCACSRIGAIVVSCNTRFRSTEVADILGRSGAKALLFWPDFKGIPFVDILSEIPPERISSLQSVIVYGGTDPASLDLPIGSAIAYEELLSAPIVEDTPVDPEDGAIMFTTSGTTSAPKFVLHSHRSVVRHAEGLARSLGYGEGTVTLTANPLCGVFGFTPALAALAVAVPQVLPTVFDAAGYASAMLRHGVTNTIAIDEAIERVLASVKEEQPFPLLKSVGSGSYNADFAAFLTQIAQRGVRGFGVYGMSEIMAVFSHQPPNADLEKRSQAGGFPVGEGAMVRTRDPESGSILPHGEVGELEVRGPSMMLGYFGDPDATAAAMTPDGYFRTGDAGYTNPDGSFTFLSRMGDALRLNGFLVSADEISSVLELHPAVDRCQVVGTMINGTQKAVAFIVPHPASAVDEADIVAFCKQRLAPFKAPARVFAVEEFPMSVGPNGEKVQRGKLRELAAQYLG